MTTATFIQAVPWWPARTKNAVELARQTEGRIVWDTNECAFDTFQAVLREMGSSAGILLEDDVVLAPRWRNRVEEVIDEHRGEVIRFFSATPGDVSAYRPGKTYCMNQCTYLPARFAEGMLAWMGTRRPKRWLDYHDWTIGERLNFCHQSYWNSVPSLVQHQPFQSLIKRGRSMKRQSESFGMEESSAT